MTSHGVAREWGRRLDRLLPWIPRTVRHKTVALAVEAAAEPLCLVVGSEDSGLSRVVEQSCDLVVRIPMAKEVESLNAGVAAGIALYEIARARRS